MADVPTATVVILVAGTITFGNEWYQTREVNWRIPLATIIGALLFDGLAHVSDRGATGLSFIVLLGALTTKFNGKSVANTLSDTFNQPKHKRHVGVA
jgi:Na+/H+ antiporter NhaB